MPEPVSSTSKRRVVTRLPGRCGSRHVSRSVTHPLDVNFVALLSRFRGTCVKRRSSMTIALGSGPEARERSAVARADHVLDERRDLVEEGREYDLRGERKVTGLDRGEVQRVLHERLGAPALLDGRHRAPVLHRERVVVVQKLCVAEDRVQWGAKLVAHVRQELALRFVRGLRRLTLPLGFAL